MSEPAYRRGRGALPGLAAAAVLLAGCGGEPQCPACQWTARGVCFCLDPADPPTLACGPEDLAPRSAATIDLALAYWSADRVPPGYEVVLRRQEPRRGYDGWCDWDERVITLGHVSGACPLWLLPHEIGHALIHDPEHADPRWRAVPGTCL